jgi:hypothetical protein
METAGDGSEVVDDDVDSIFRALLFVVVVAAKLSCSCLHCARRFVEGDYWYYR